MVVFNDVARSVIEKCRGVHPTHVFTYTPPPRKAKPGEVVEIPVPRPVAKMNTTAWKAARVRAAGKWEQEHGELAPDGFRRSVGTARPANLPQSLGFGGKRADKPLIYGAPGGTRTPDHRLRRPMLYPAELRARRVRSISWPIPPRRQTTKPSGKVEWPGQPD